ncbi:MAG: adenylate/guanylate cyclase domain-containing protein [Fimbriimonadaceae bacterium]|nr:adenylate/guanylate cyclase domain-containing protein [Fimbriimonadaceae bacterium]
MNLRFRPWPRSRSARQGRPLPAPAVGVGLAVTVALLAATPLLEEPEDVLYDARIALRGERPAYPEVVVVAISSDTTVDWWEPQAFWGTRYARLLGRLSAAGPSVIGLDVIVQSRTDEFLTQVLEEQGVDHGPTPNADLTSAAMALGPRLVLAEARFTAEGPIASFDKLRSIGLQNDAIGFVDVVPSRDRTVRDAYLYARDTGVESEPVEPSFAALLAARHRGLDPRSADGLANLARYRTRDDQVARFAIDFCGRVNALDARRVLDDPPAQWADQVRGKVVLIGSTEVAAKDAHRVPLGRNLPGVWVHAEAVSTLLGGTALARVVGAGGFLATLLVGLGAAGFAAGRRQGTVLAGGVATATVYAFGSQAVFMATGTALPLAGPLLAATAATSTGLWVRAAHEAWARRRREDQLGTFMSPQVRDRLLSLEGPISMEPTEPELTIVFVDMRDSTAIAHGANAREVMDIVNRVFEATVPAFLERNAVINRFLGDGFLALFGLDGASKNPAQDAVDAAIGAVLSVRALDLVVPMEKEGRVVLESVRIGCGVHTGRVAAGFVGHGGRLDFTVIGDAVNTAARIEGKNQDYRSELLVSDATYGRLDPAPPAAHLGPVAIRGRSPIVLHRVRFAHDGIVEAESVREEAS